MHPIAAYYASQPEPVQGCLLALRAHILAQAGAGEISEAWSYGMPFFQYRGRRLCYLWTQKSDGQPYVGFVDGTLLDHPDLVSAGRKRMKILLVDPQADLPVATLHTLLRQAIDGVGRLSA